MCGVCGCGKSGTVPVPRGATQHPHGHGHGHGHGHAHGHSHPHDHDHEHDHGHDHHDHDHDAHARIVRVERDILEKNDRLAATNRRLFAATRTLALNLLSSPGAGKTTLLERLLRELRQEMPVAVIEGDQATSLDADRIAATGAAAVQINTGKMCHLDAGMIAEALGSLPPVDGGVLFVENVGNLVCPAAFDLGEAAKVVLASVTEGEDKPLKYPDMFHAADLVLVTKIDLVPHLGCDVELLEANVRKVNPRTAILRVSARSGEGVSTVLDWIAGRRGEISSARNG